MPIGRPTDRRPRRAFLAAALLAYAAAATAPAAVAAPQALAADRGAPYAASTTITSFELDWSTLRKLAPGSDNWPTTWAKDGSVYAAWGDGSGFGGGRVSLGFARLSGASAGQLRGQNLPRSGVPNGKSYGVLALGDTLYSWISPGSNAQNYQEARIYSSRLGAGGWKRAGWAFGRGQPGRIILPTFLQAGRDYANGGAYVYAYAPRYAPTSGGRLSLQKGGDGGEIALMRAPKGSLMSQSAWEHFAGLDAKGGATWSKDQRKAKPVITDEKGVGWTVSATYDKGLGRYLVATEHSASFASRLTLLEAPNPWGPWRTAAYTTLSDPKGRIDRNLFHFNFLANSFSSDGRRFTLVMTGTGNTDALLAVDGRFGGPSGKGAATVAATGTAATTEPTDDAATDAATDEVTASDAAEAQPVE